MPRLKAHILVQGKAVRPAEVEAVLLMPAGKLIVDRQRGGSGGQSQDSVRLSGAAGPQWRLPPGIPICLLPGRMTTSMAATFLVPATKSCPWQV